MSKEEILARLEEVEKALWFINMSDRFSDKEWNDYYRLLAEERKLKDMLEGENE